MPVIDKLYSIWSNAKMTASHDLNENGYFHAPNFITPDEVAGYYEDTQTLPARRVMCGDGSISWSEQIVPQESSLFAFFKSPRVLNTLSVCLGVSVPNILDLTCWTSIYNKSEFINPHFDSAGDLQIILCLKAPSKCNGGNLILEYKLKTFEVHLSPSDALFFFATKVRHQTTPLLPSSDLPEPVRVVGVARYYFNPKIM